MGEGAEKGSNHHIGLARRMGNSTSRGQCLPCVFLRGGKSKRLTRNSLDEAKLDSQESDELFSNIMVLQSHLMEQTDAAISPVEQAAGGANSAEHINLPAGASKYNEQYTKALEETPLTVAFEMLEEAAGGAAAFFTHSQGRRRSKSRSPHPGHKSKSPRRISSVIAKSCTHVEERPFGLQPGTAVSPICETLGELSQDGDECMNEKTPCLASSKPNIASLRPVAPWLSPHKGMQTNMRLAMAAVGVVNIGTLTASPAAAQRGRNGGAA